MPLAQLVEEKVARLRQEATAAAAGGRHADAAALLSNAIYLAPDDPPLYASRAEAYTQLCDFASAVINYRRALQLRAGDAAYARRLAELHDLRAMSLATSADHTAAVSELDHAIALAPTDARLLLHRAICRAGAGQHAAALQDVEASIALERDSADAHFLLAKLLLLSQRLADARAAADAALAVDAEHGPTRELVAAMVECAQVYADEATNLGLLGMHLDAASNLSHAVSLSPTDTGLRVRRGGALRQGGRHEEAVVVLEEAIALAGRGGYPAARRLLSLAYNDVGIARAAAGLTDEALQWMNQAIESMDERCAESPTLYLNRGDLLHRIHRPVDALRDYECASKLCVADPQLAWSVRGKMAVLHNDAGTAHFNRTQARHAALSFSRAIDCNPKVAQFYVNRAEATLALSRFELARDDALAALKLDPSHARAKELLARLCPGAA